MAEVLSSLSDALAGAVETAGKSVVRVEGRRRQSASGIVWSADGLVVTANHVVTRDEDIRVGLPNGETSDATVVGRDPTTDIALLRTAGGKLTAANWAKAADVRVGHLVLAVGRPETTMQATLGVISALGNAWRTAGGGMVDQYIQTDVVMYPGFSGGPLVDVSGGIVGLNSSALARGVSLTLPAATISSVVETLATHGRIRRGYLGIGAQPVRLPETLTEQLGQEIGLLIVSVEAETPAASAGLVLGDTLLALDGQKVGHIEELMALLTGDRVGQQVSAKILRGGEVREMKVTIGERNS
jgi:S1-C subfamily serine protease